MNTYSSIITKKILAPYKRWQIEQKHIPKMNRYSLGVKIDTLFVLLIELIQYAQYSDKKIPYLNKIIVEVNVLKNLLLTLYEIQGISEKAYVEMSAEIEEVGKMVYVWNKRLGTQKKTNI